MRLVSRLPFSRWHLPVLIPLVLVLPGHDTTTAATRRAQAQAITATLLMEAIEDTAAAADYGPLKCKDM